MVTVEDIKTALGITGENFDSLLTIYMDNTKDYLISAGVPEDRMTAGIIARGVADQWNYGAGAGTWSKIFIDQATQLALGGKS